jgi:hypothetical protein
MMLLVSHADNGTAESCWRWCYQSDVSRGELLLPSHAGDGTMSHASDDAVEATWPWRDVAVESWW